mmetsp:Transcript_17595/g.36964  ORF Transcript_17595/g.36964 Transcript_17595/m.36964 type:complete len:250 (+) Transcript_17595:85-834(+)
MNIAFSLLFTLICFVSGFTAFPAQLQASNPQWRIRLQQELATQSVSTKQLEIMAMWDGKYSSDEYVFGTKPNDFLESVSSKLAPNSSVLSLGEGEGRNAVFLAKLGHDVLGVDASAVGLEKAQKLAREHGTEIDTKVADLESFDMEVSKWDGVVSIFCHMPSELRKEVYKKIVGGLKPGGILILEAYTPKQLEYKTGGPPVADMMPTLDLLKVELDGLYFEIGEEKERDVVEGRLHTGKAHVVQVVARK